MKTVNIAELRTRLSTYIQAARSGEEIVIRDRNLPVAKLVRFSATDTSSEELALVAEGKLTVPGTCLDTAALWAIGSQGRANQKLRERARRTVSQDRENRDAGLLGR